MENEYETKLDSLLKYLLKKEIAISENHNPFPYYNEIIKELKLSDYDELLELIEILFEDKYITANFYFTLSPFKDGDIKVIQNAKITTKGRIFVSRSGYVQKEKHKNLMDSRIEDAEKITRLMLKVASISTAALVVIELYRIWHHLTWE